MLYICCIRNKSPCTKEGFYEVTAELKLKDEQERKR